MQIKVVLKVAALGCSLLASVAAAGEFDAKQVDAIFARTSAQADGVYRYGFPRSDLNVVVDGVTIKSAPSVTGTASDPSPGSGVAQVSLAIRNVTDNRWWDGNDFTATTERFLLATGTTSWWSPLPALTTGKTYELKSKGFDAATNAQSSFVVNTFTFDNLAPTTVVVSPVNNVNVKTAPAGVTGTAADATAPINQVELSVKNLTDNTFWKPASTAFAAGQAWFTATGTSSWFYNNITWIAGKQYLVQTRGTDNPGNLETPSAGNSFIYESSAPATTITSHTNNAQLKALNTLSGTVTDSPAVNAGVDANGVRVVIRNMTNTLYWTGSSFDVSSTYVAAVHASGPADEEREDRLDDELRDID